MDKNDIIEYWVTSALNDYTTMKNLFLSKDYAWSLFVGHIVVEKLLKALYVQEIDEAVPKTHDLNRIVLKIGIDVSDILSNQFDRITAFNISARYPDYKLSFYKKCDTQFTEASIKMIEEVRRWILDKLPR